MTNYLHQGRSMQYTVPSGVTLKVNQVILLGNILAVVFSTNNNTATASNPSAIFGPDPDVVTLSTYGVFKLPKATGTGTGWSIGAPVYWDVAAQAVTGLNGANTVAAKEVLTVSTGAASGDTLNTLNVGATPLLAGTITFGTGSATVTAAAIVAGINANTIVSGYSATNTAGVITITGPANLGAGLNGITPTIVTTVAVTLVLSAAAFAGGVSGNVGVAATETMTVTTAAADGDILPSITVNGLNLFAGRLVFPAASYDTTTTAAAIVAQINANTVNTGYSATNSSAIITITGPTNLGATINTVVPVVAATTTVSGGTGTMVMGTPGAFSGGIDGIANFLIGYGWDQVAANADVTGIVKLKTT